MLSYKPITHRDISRLISIIKVDKNIKEYLIEKLAKIIAENLNSEIVDKKIFYFPSKDNNFKDFTYIAILSSSHLVISSYSDEEETYLDIDIAWCSGKKINCKDIISMIKEVLKDKIKGILTIKIYDYLGNIIDGCDDGFLTWKMMIAEFSDQKFLY